MSTVLHQLLHTSLEVRNRRKRMSGELSYLTGSGYNSFKDIR